MKMATVAAIFLNTPPARTPFIAFISPKECVTLGGLTWEVGCNPEAPEIVRRLEVSSNLIDWRPAQATDFRIESGLNCLSWTLQPGKRRLHCRLKVGR